MAMEMESIQKTAWQGFENGDWQHTINVRDFIQKNFRLYDGDESFLAGPTQATENLWDKVMELTEKERENGGVYDLDTTIVSSITSHGPGYLNQDLEKVVGVQTDVPFKRGLMPYGGIRMAHNALESYGYTMAAETDEVFKKHRKTHNQGVFDAYTPEMKLARKVGIITGLPDAYGRGRIIGDYRRVALYGTDQLISAKQAELNQVTGKMSAETIQLREEIQEQTRALQELTELGKMYGFDLSRPAETALEAFQWLYLGYLAAIKEQNGAAMSLGRVSTFLDIYIERDLENGRLTEEEAQELVDHFVMKLRLVKFARTPEYNELFSGDPTWVTESIAGIGEDGRPLVTKSSFRFLHTLSNLGPAPEPNLTVLWSPKLTDNFKHYCAKMSMDTSSIQYENDEIMRPEYGDDYGIACCVSAMEIGKQMQFFGARANLAKSLLYAINGGVDEKMNMQVVDGIEPITSEYLDYDEVSEKFETVMDWLAELYINTLNIIHYMHDKYSYERIMMALHDKDVRRTMATGIAGLSVAADSLSAIKHSNVRVIRDENGLAVDFEIEGEYPQYGNDDDRVDLIAKSLVEKFSAMLKKHDTYRNAETTMSILTITSNVVYGKKTGNTPDGRKDGEPFAPGANPMHGRDQRGALASLNSVAKMPYDQALDGISNTFSIVPKALGKDDLTKKANLSAILDGYMDQTGHHLNVNVFDRETLIDAMDQPEKYPQLTVRVSGYAVNFIKLTREQQLDVINRTFHETI
ncbi:formate C-acetyltransferase [Salisediminibacterium halotolerans]|uniref:Formate acetyltransferase n=2 Tax=Salisediminibacterium halotolerans TaxID=517425 RepID=A0A1H9RME4_9BACI|nr:MULTISPECIES: formate C-acetyltransferase [Salisediminibacterium]RLJ77836.1 formate C-acetyltransferase [Actinophytocola xinjiangensis]RPE82817.1 formate C-acetyltransferase [Salisediminibacterium halotolerans]TWG36813.1 formate C-acetyltransferase [Salisediminibacterium halotolerans]SER73817.1 formate C-acetyltransferase [Salisediminibacterium haloalkalitolerans]GEL08719.1 formate C-acetyltransferase [Salisediminibacterium halotolerans]